MLIGETMYYYRDKGYSFAIDSCKYDDHYLDYDHMCNKNAPKEFFWCSRPKDHDGDHEAKDSSNKKCIIIWTQAEAMAWDL